MAKTLNREKRVYASTLAKERALRGKIDQFSIWQKELTQDEVDELVELGKISVLWAMSSQ